MEAGGTVALWRLQSVNLPAGPIGAGLEHAIQVIRSMFRRWIRADMTRSQTILNGQQIHTSPSITIMIVSMGSMVVDGRKPVCSLRTD